VNNDREEPHDVDAEEAREEESERGLGREDQLLREGRDRVEADRSGVNAARDLFGPEPDC
jgi:hypothetical protein